MLVMVIVIVTMIVIVIVIVMVTMIVIVIVIVTMIVIVMVTMIVIEIMIVTMVVIMTGRYFLSLSVTFKSDWFSISFPQDKERLLANQFTRDSFTFISCRQRHTE